MAAAIISTAAAPVTPALTRANLNLLDMTLLGRNPVNHPMST
jgi:hypothetical protein